MVYSSLLFIYIFLPAALAVYCFVPKKLKNIVLLLESMVFCGFMGIKLLLLLIVYCAGNYTAALFIYRIRPKLKCIPLGVGILFDVLILLSFRAECFSQLHGFMKLPEGAFLMGVSFFTLSAIGYLIDVYKGSVKADKNFVRFSLYIMMFPRLIMGPVVSYDSFVAIIRRRRLNLAEIGSGLTIFIKGMAKKVLVADSLYMLYTAVKSTDLSKLSAAVAWLGIIAYVLCLYFTMSGLSDMGVGLGRCFGFRFPNSFGYLIFGGRIRVFVSKWYIQVIYWFRKYITRPLSSMMGNPYLSKLVFVGVWTLAGYWYGFNPGSAVWGMLMGISIIIENKLRNFKLMKSNGIVYTVLVITVLSVFLSAGNVSDAFGYLWVMIGGNGVLADSMTAYLLRSYIVVLLVAVYASTDLFKNMVTRINASRFKWIMSVLTPIAAMLLLGVCTSLMAYSGRSDVFIIKL